MARSISFLVILPNLLIVALTLEEGTMGKGKKAREGM
jgi:hypothetical protein